MAGSAGTLEARQVRVHFEGVKAVDGVDCVVHTGEILGLIGPNGAGKTTLVNCLSGFQPKMEGQVYLDGEDVTGLPPHRLARRGLARTFQNVRLFGDFTVLENVEVAGVAGGLGRREAVRRARELLDLVGLRGKDGERASSLPHGDEQRLGIARALATRPRFILLDEPAAGLNEVESDELMGVIVRIRDELACGVLTIEHDMRVIMALSGRIQVLNYGRTIGEGSPAEIRSDPVVIAAYLGSRRGDDRAAR